MEAKERQVNIKVSESELKTLKASAEKENVSVSQYVRTKACACGESGYEGIFKSVTWACPKCKKINTWKAK